MTPQGVALTASLLAMPLVAFLFYGYGHRRGYSRGVSDILRRIFGAPPDETPVLGHPRRAGRLERIVWGLDIYATAAAIGLGIVTVAWVVLCIIRDYRGG